MLNFPSDALGMTKLQDSCPVMLAKIPKPILKEIDGWVNESKKFKDSPLAELKAHENVGYNLSRGKKHNSYQTSISPHLIEQSFWLAWVLRLTKKYWGMGKDNRAFKLRKWDGHLMGMIFGLTLHIKEMIILCITMQDSFQV